MIYGVDAYGTVSGAALRATGRRFACRYVSGYNPLSFAEARDLTVNGIGIVSLYETDPAEALGARAAGESAAELALVGAELGTGRIRMPHGSAVIFAADFDVQTFQREDVFAYWLSARNVLRNHGLIAGAYGPQEVVEAAMVFGLVDLGMVAAGWRSGLPISPRIQLVQTIRQVEIAGVTCDEDIATTPHFGAWNLSGLWPPIEGEDRTMIVTHSPTGAAFVVSGSRKMPVDAEHWPAIAAQALPTAQMSLEELDLLELVEWGEL